MVFVAALAYAEQAGQLYILTKVPQLAPSKVQPSTSTRS
jgi:hypothetical protein